MAGLKRAIIATATGLGCLPAGLAAQRALFGRHHLRVLNYHQTPAHSRDGLERQLAFYLRHYDPAGPDDLDACLAGRLAGNRPRLLITFDDGYRSNHDVAAPLLEKHGFRAFFFLPEAYVAADRAAADAAFAAASDEPEPRLCWPEARALEASGHRIGCHSRTHVRLGDDLSGERLHDEITRAGQDMAAALGHPVEDFCWVGGEEWSYGAGAFDEIRRAGYRRVFMTNLLPVRPGSSPIWIQRTNVEAGWPLREVEFYLSGLMDLAYAPKRRRLARKLLSRA
ncbi:polysaccharide deacetylase family protein [Reyranella sp.]|uniref:polysaccharide deacetylase family protein n=1 Tax=Reyranella sp. TaxID=1929291 RepID=UPI003BABBEBB